MTDGGAAVLGLSSAQRYCPKLLFGGAVPALTAMSGSAAGLLAFDGLLGVLRIVSSFPMPDLGLSLPAHNSTAISFLFNDIWSAQAQLICLRDCSLSMMSQHCC